MVRGVKADVLEYVLANDMHVHTRMLLRIPAHSQVIGKRIKPHVDLVHTKPCWIATMVKPMRLKRGIRCGLDRLAQVCPSARTGGVVKPTDP